MKPILIIAIALVLLIPLPVFAEPDFRYAWKETWEKLGDHGITMLQHVVIDSDDNLYITDSNRIVKVTTDNQREWTVISVGGLTGEIYLNHNDEIIVPISSKNIMELRKYSSSSDLIKTWNLVHYDTDPKAILNWYVDKNETIFVSERFYDKKNVLQDIGTLKKFDASGNILKMWENMGLLRAVDDAGNLYTTGNGKIVKYDPNGNKIAEYGEQKYRGGVGTFSHIAPSIIIDSNGIIFATGGDFGPINIIDEDGNFNGIGGYGIRDGQYGSPRGIALDSENNAYVTDYSRDKVLVFERIYYQKTIQSELNPTLEPEPVITADDQYKIICSAPDGYCMSKVGMNNPEAYGICLETWVPFCQTYEIKQTQSEPQEPPHDADLDGFTPSSEIICGTGTIEKNDQCVPDHPNTEPSSKGGGCLIATATYGSELAPQVQQLRELRDNSLSQSESGTNFMSTFNDVYYSFSPIIADYERENPLFKELVKLTITPMISSLSILNYVDMDSEYEVLGYGISLIILNGMMYVGVPLGIVIGIRKSF